MLVSHGSVALQAVWPSTMPAGMTGTAAVPSVGEHRPPEPRRHLVACVVHAVARAGAALKAQAVPHPRVERHINAVPVVRFAAEVVGGRVVRIRRAEGAPRVAREERDRVAASVGQARIRAARSG